MADGRGKGGILYGGSSCADETSRPLNERMRDLLGRARRSRQHRQALAAEKQLRAARIHAATCSRMPQRCRRGDPRKVEGNKGMGEGCKDTIRIQQHLGNGGGLGLPCYSLHASRFLARNHPGSLWKAHGQGHHLSDRNYYSATGVHDCA